MGIVRFEPGLGYNANVLTIGAKPLIVIKNRNQSKYTAKYLAI